MIRFTFSPVLRRRVAHIVSCLFFLAAASGTASAKSSSLLWKISGNGLGKPSYLYGTIHIKDKRVFEFSKAMKSAMAETPAFALELNLDSALSMDILPLMMLDSGRTIKDLMSAEDYRLVHEALQEKMGPQAFVIEKMKPVIIATLISLQSIEEDFEQALDQHLFNEAKIANKKIYGIETAAEQLKAFDTMPMKDQIDMLVEQVRDEDKSTSDTQEMIDAYIAADLDKLIELIKASGIKNEVYEALLTKRNHIMAERIARIAKQQPVFAAIGLGHLPGDEGVIALLRKQGYTVEPIR